MPDLPDVYFGGTEPRRRNWREEPDDDSGDDDEPLAKTPNDVVRLLGFDPLKEPSAE